MGIAHKVWVDGTNKLEKDEVDFILRAIEAINPGALLHWGDGGDLPVSQLMHRTSGVESVEGSVRAFGGCEKQWLLWKRFFGTIVLRVVVETQGY